MAVQDSEESFLVKTLFKFVNEEYTLRLIAVEPKRVDACERVYVTGAEAIVDERRFACAGGTGNVKALDIPPLLSGDKPRESCESSIVPYEDGRSLLRNGADGGAVSHLLSNGVEVSPASLSGF